MRSLALSSESALLRTTHLSPPFSMASKPLNFLQLRVSSKNLAFSRYSVRQSMEFNCARLSQHKACEGKISQAACRADADTCYSDTNETISLNKSRTHFTPNVQVLDMPFSRYMKFMMLCGIFTLENTQQAVAGSDISSGFSFLGDLGDISTGFASAFLLIFFSELGDKTFFIAALLAARNSAAVIFLGTFGALGVMTIISVALGRTFHYVDDLLPFRFGDTDLPIDDIAAVLLLVYFGVSTLLEASTSDGLKAEEEQKEAELAVSDFSGNGAGILAAANTIFSTFLLVFVAEWGDKSFFSTIALAAASSPLGVVGGALAGHGAATLLAVLGGSLLGTFLSEKNLCIAILLLPVVLKLSLLGSVIAYIGGTLFLVFAAVTLFEIVT